MVRFCFLCLRTWDGPLRDSGPSAHLTNYYPAHKISTIRGPNQHEHKTQDTRYFCSSPLPLHSSSPLTLTETPSLAGKRVVFFATHIDLIINRHRGFCLAFLWGSVAFCFGLLLVDVVSQMAAKNAPFYSLITILTYFSTSLYTTRFIKQQSLFGSIGVCAVRVGVPFVVAEWWCFVRCGGADGGRNKQQNKSWLAQKQDCRFFYFLVYLLRCAFVPCFL
jgi:hypothetical protein